MKSIVKGRHTIITMVFTIMSLTSLQSQTVTWHEQEGIPALMERHIQLNKQQQYIEGWRVQLLATTDRLEMQQFLREFEIAFPDYKVNWVHEKPWYKLRVGAFGEKFQAIQLQHKLKEAYPGAYPTKDPNMLPKELVD